MPFQIIRNDITKVKADAIVNTANPRPVIGGGTDSAIYEAAGKKQLLAERKKIGDVARGDAAVTPAFGLKSKYIIHTVGPIWEGGDKGEFDILKSCYEKSLQLALELGCKSIAFPLIATGVYGFPKDKALNTAISVINSFILEHDMKVIMVVFNEKAFQLSGKLVEKVRSYIDENYVEKAREREYGSRRNDQRERRRQEEIYQQRRRADEDTSQILGSIIEPNKEKTEADARSQYAASSKVDIDGLLESSEKTFQEKLFEIIDERQLTGPQVYDNYISRQVYSKIQCDKDYHPNKYTAIALCLSLHLSLAETQDLIGRAGWTLSPSSKADLIVKACILNKEYNIVKINLILFDYHCPELSKIK